MASVAGITATPYRAPEIALTPPSSPKPAAAPGFIALPDNKAVSPVNLQKEMLEGRWAGKARLNDAQDSANFLNMQVIDLPSGGLRNTGSRNEQKPSKLGLRTYP